MLKKICILKALILVLTLLISITGCTMQSSNPDSTKVKQLEDEMINVKLQVENTNKALEEQKRDLEIIKEHLIPSYKSSFTEDNSEDTTTETNSTTDNSETNTSTGQVNIPNSGSINSSTNASPVPGVPINPQTNSLPNKGNIPASNNTKDTQPTTASNTKNYTIPQPKVNTSGLTPQKTVPKVNIPQPQGPLPTSPSMTRNINYTFTDIMNSPYRQYIGVLSTIGGILDKSSGTFAPLQKLRS